MYLLSYRKTEVPRNGTAAGVRGIWAVKQNVTWARPLNGPKNEGSDQKWNKSAFAPYF